MDVGKIDTLNISSNGKEGGHRYNQGKPMYELIHPIAERGLVDVLSFGARKYAPHNWEKGLSWMEVCGSLRRHLAAFMMGEDIDPESGLKHVDHIQCNAHFLSAYTEIAKEFDDRISYGKSEPDSGPQLREKGSFRA